MLEFTTNGDEIALIGEIADRAAEFSPCKMDTLMDIDACHSNGCALDLVALAAANISDLVHDVVGISNHINRKTGELEDGFLPRYAKP